MDDDAVIDPPSPRPGPPTDDPLQPYRGWASVLCLLLVLVGLLGLGLILASGLNADARIIVTAGAFALLGIGVFAAEGLGLQSIAPWAVHAVRPLCIVLILGGAIRVVVALSAGSLTIPLEAVGALLVLTRDHRPELLPALDQAGRRTMAIVVALAVVVQLGPAVMDPIGRGDLFGASEATLGLTVATECTAPVTQEDPATIRVAWTWASGEPFTPPADGVLISWHLSSPESPDGEDASTFGGSRTSDPERIWDGGEGEASGALAQSVDSGGRTWEYGIDLQPGGLLDGWVELDVAPADPSVTSGMLDAQAWYAHGGRWVKASDLASCVW